MAHDDPFTLDLFGNTALSSGLGLGVTAFGGTFANDDDDEPDPSTPAPALPIAVSARATPLVRPARGSNFRLVGDRLLARTWKDRGRDNIAAIRLAAEIEADQRPATAQEQAQLIRFTGFGASDLANGVFRRPGEADFREGWQELGASLEDAVGELVGGEDLGKAEAGKVPPFRAALEIVDDPDVPIERIPSGVFDHWVCWNLPPATAIIDAPQASGGTHGSNSRSTRQYVLPAPPLGDGEHRYYFRAYALDTRIELAAGATKAELLTAMAGHVVDSAELMGRYRRRG